MTPRRLALQILREHRNGKSFVDDLVDERAPREMSKVDRGFLTTLVYGVTRHRRTLEHLLEKFSTSGFDRIHPDIAMAIELGMYQLLYLERVPEYAAVNESVEMAKEVSPASSKFANAILRKLVRLIESKGQGADDRDQDARTLETWDARQVVFREPVFVATDSIKSLEIRYSYPAWLVKRWVSTYGFQRALEICRAGNQPLPLTVRVKAKPVELIKRLAREGVKAHPGTIEGCLHLHGVGKLADLKTFKEGLFQVQDESAIQVALSLGVKDGERLLDLCGAPGGKATHLAELSPKGLVLAVDVSLDKVRLVRSSCDRLKLANVRTIVADSRRLHLREPFDGVLIDAPCSNTGVLSRRPDARWRISPADLKKLPLVQISLLKSAAEKVREGGRLVYSTCSIEPEENEQVVQQFLREDDRFFLADTRLLLPSIQTGGGFFAKLVRKAP